MLIDPVTDIIDTFGLVIVRLAHPTERRRAERAEGLKRAFHRLGCHVCPSAARLRRPGRAVADLAAVPRPRFPVCDRNRFGIRFTQDETSGRGECKK